MNMVRRFQRAFQTDPKEMDADQPSRNSNDRAPRPISIWQPKLISGKIEYRRPDPGVFGDHFSNQLRFVKEKSAHTTRICYFGESVAAGYLYAPHLYPAELLQKTLNHAGAGHNFEVIDLSRTNETLASVLNTFESSLQLEPDICVFFFGNNWSLLETPETSPHFHDDQARQKIGKVFSESGFDSLADWVVETRLRRTASTFAEIHQLGQENEIKIILVIPEVNLADWESRQPVPVLPEDGIHRWYQQYNLAQTYLEEKDWENLLEAGFELWNLDRGTCPTTYRMIGLAHLGLEDRVKARAAFQAEIDSVMLPYMAFLNAPQITSYDIALMRRAAREYNFGLVDLPEVFARISNEKIPDREFFLDYCHLTIKGIRIAVAAIAGEICQITDTCGKQAGRFEVEPDITPEDQALAEFGAAIHTAHRLVSSSDRKDILSYWCKKALQTSPGIVPAMIQLVQARIAPLPELLTEAQQGNLNSNYRLLHAHGWKYDNLDIDLIQAIQVVLKEHHPGIDEMIDNLLIEYHAVEDYEIDLVSSIKYHWNPLEQSYDDLLIDSQHNMRGYFRAVWPDSNFVFASRADDDLKLTLTARIKNNQVNEEIKVIINGSLVESCTITCDFKQIQMDIPKSCLIKGENKLTITWPVPQDSTKIFSEITERLLLGHNTSFMPVFGDIYSLVISKPQQ